MGAEDVLWGFIGERFCLDEKGNQEKAALELGLYTGMCFCLLPRLPWMLWVQLQTIAVKIVIIFLSVEGLAFYCKKRNICEVQTNEVDLYTLV